MTHQLIRKAVNKELAAKGYTLANKQSADFLVSHSIYANLGIPERSAREERAIREQDIATGHLERELPPGVGYGGHASGEGALYLFFTQPDGRAAWRGSVETVLNYRGAGVKKVPAAIRKVLQDFPSRSGGQ